MNLIDLRSDTVSWPTPAMREAMASAPVGDDVFGDDPTVNEMQRLAADMLGKEAALFVPSGTMGNLTSVLTHCQRGDEFIVGKQAHIFRYEAGGASIYGGLQANTVPVQTDGTLDLDDVRRAVRSDNPHHPVTRLICLENTQGTLYGSPISAEYVAQVAQIAADHQLRLHVDGARLFNAATALGVSARELVAKVDSVSVCLSKGLCAPVGSVIAGSQSFIARAHRIRKSLGGGMRQAGILAAAGIIALRDMTTRLHEDHETARQFALGIADIPHIEVDLARVRTNMVYFRLTAGAPYSADELSANLRTNFGILMRPYDPREGLFRVVTHYWITPEHIEQTLNALRILLDRTSRQGRSAAD